MSQPTSFLDIIETKLLPWILQDGMERFIVARSQMKQMKPKSGIQLLTKKLIGPRKAVRIYTFSGISATWPNDKLLETHAPMLSFVIKGQADLNCGDYILRLPEGYGLFIPGDVPRWTGETAISYLGNDPQRFSQTIHFVENSGSLHAWIAYQHGNKHSTDGQKRLLLHNAVLLRLLDDMQRELQKEKRGNREICKRLLEIFLMTIARDLHEDRCVYSFEQKAEGTLSNETYNSIAEAQKYIRSNLHEHLTQDSVARAVRLSRTQFIRRFREETGQTFNRFVTECRIERAKVLLRTTNFPLTFIYGSLGYKSSSHFNALFRKSIGKLPREFREEEFSSKRDQ